MLDRSRLGERDAPGGLDDRDAARDLHGARSAPGRAREPPCPAEDGLRDLEELRVAGKAEADVAVPTGISRRGEARQLQLADDERAPVVERERPEMTAGPAIAEDDGLVRYVPESGDVRTAA